MASLASLPAIGVRHGRPAPTEKKKQHASAVPTLPKLVLPLSASTHTASKEPASARLPSEPVRDTVDPLIPLTARPPASKRSLKTVYESQPWRAALDEFRLSKQPAVAAPPAVANASEARPSPEALRYAETSSLEVDPVLAAELKDAHAFICRPSVLSPKQRKRAAAAGDGRNYIAETMVALREDPGVWVDFASRTNALVAQRREEQRQLSESLRPSMEASRIPVDREASALRHAERMLAARENRVAVAHTVVEELQLEAAATAKKQDRAEMVRNQLHASKLLRKEWLLNVFLAKSVAAIVIARHVGYRRRWVRLLCVYIGRHWIRLSRRRQEVFATLRLNYFIRRNLPTVVENFRYRRSTAAAPMVQKFLRQYTHVMQFINAMRTFMRRVRQVQMISRRKRLARAVLVGALRLGWERAATELRSERTMLIEFPDAVREHIILRCILAEQAAFGKVRHAIFSEWRRLRADHERFLETKRSLLGSTESFNHGSQNAKSQFIERQFSSSRAFFDGQQTPLFQSSASNVGSPLMKSQTSPGFGSKDAAVAAADVGQALTGGSRIAAAERRVRLIEPSNGSKLHPSQRFGSNKSVSNKDSTLSATHAAVAASKHRLFPPAGDRSGQPVSALRRQGSTVMIASSSFRRNSNAGVAPSGGGILPWTIDPEYLMHPPPLPGRKVLCRVHFMRELIVRARDAVYAGIRTYRQEQAAAAKARAELESGGSGSAGVETTPQSEPLTRNSSAAPLVRIHVASKKSHTGTHTVDHGADAFSVPSAFLDDATLNRYVDFSWIQSFINSAPPVYTVSSEGGRVYH